MKNPNLLYAMLKGGWATRELAEKELTRAGMPKEIRLRAVEPRDFGWVFFTETPDGRRFDLAVAEIEAKSAYLSLAEMVVVGLKSAWDHAFRKEWAAIRNQVAEWNRNRHRRQ